MMVNADGMVIDGVVSQLPADAQARPMLAHHQPVGEEQFEAKLKTQLTAMSEMLEAFIDEHR
jgi:hypothetical protein